MKKLFTSFLFLLLPIIVFAQLTITNLTVSTIIQVPLNPLYTYGTLGYTLYTNLNWIVQSTNTGIYNNTLTISTNNNLWTWPLNLSCVNLGEDGLQHVLLSPNVVLVNCHYGVSIGEAFTFTDTNGIQWTQYVSNLVSQCDLELAIMSNSYPSSVVPPFIWPVNWTNKIVGKTPINLPCFWIHNNTRTLEYATIQFWNPNNSTPFAYNVTLGIGTSTNYPHGGTGPTGGDSGSPVFMVFNGSPVLLYAMTLATGQGCCVSDPLYWNTVTNTSPNAKVIDLSNYPN